MSELSVLVIDALCGAAVTVWLGPSSTLCLSTCVPWSQDSISKKTTTVYSPLNYETK